MKYISKEISDQDLVQWNKFKRNWMRKRGIKMTELKPTNRRKAAFTEDVLLQRAMFKHIHPGFNLY